MRRHVVESLALGCTLALGGGLPGCWSIRGVLFVACRFVMSSGFLRGDLGLTGWLDRMFGSSHESLSRLHVVVLDQLAEGRDMGWQAQASSLLLEASRTVRLEPLADG